MVVNKMDKRFAALLAGTAITSTVYLAVTASHSATVMQAARAPRPKGVLPVIGPYSVVMPTLNEAGNIRQALDSLFNQSIQPDEIIIVDSNSQDGTVQIAQSYPRVRVNSIPQVGNVGVARDSGVKLARNEIIMAMDADTIWGWNVAEETLLDLIEGGYDIVHAPGITKNLAANALYYAAYSPRKPAWRIDGRHIATTKTVLARLGGFHGPTCETYAIGIEAARQGLRVLSRPDLPVIHELNLNRQRRAPLCEYHPFKKVV